MTKYDLPNKLFEILRTLGGEATILEVCKTFWGTYENELRNSGDLFYTWQYDIRWAATDLRKNGRMVAAEISSRGVWELKI